MADLIITCPCGLDLRASGLDDVQACDIALAWFNTHIHKERD